MSSTDKYAGGGGGGGYGITIIAAEVTINGNVTANGGAGESVRTGMSLVVAAAKLALLPMSLLRAVALLPTAEVVALLGSVLPLVLTVRLVQS